MTDSYKSTLSLIGRILLALMFITSGFGKLADLQGTAAYVASGGLPFPIALALLAGLLELFGGIALVIGFRVRLAGVLLGLFTLVASVAFHAYWAAPADQQFVTQLLFMKNLSVAGGLFLISALGAGPLSLDAARLKR
ncbi:DoxX family protein [Eoetvoesiella caeni]|uniref:Putative oxidoreductase n=1 Tax=Eoetvoesiella caeni TaxID=645616 RepID=A0A366H4H9_9BURK|nr:DoxX family protein [Eoetvoesiella caeni]MCI2810836.1 DoxX family protein [Eoetvoesiella caeni]NYT56734.1 DoxX family protein [Eoetvoesiella caeni]RBP35758.1 putative oxidoreductase [Eoetvoesiella caeni]